MSETTTTPNYGLIKPNVNADSDLWGDHLNSDMDIIDSKMKSIENKAGVTTWNTRSGTVALNQADVTTVLPPGAGTPAMDGTATPGALMTWSRSDHVHPTDTTRYAASNPAGYVTAGGAATAAPVQSVATRTGAVVLTHTDITDWTPTLAPYAPLASPALTGSPTAPTVSPTTDSSTKLATTAFVQSALGAVPGGAIVSATPPAASPGALWFDSTGGQTYVRYDDGNSVQWVPSANITGLANAAQLSDVAPAYNNVGRNLIHNSMFNIAQRGAGPWTVGGYTADRWQQSIGTSDTLSSTIISLADADRGAIGDENARSGIQLIYAGAATTSSYIAFVQKLESVRRLSGKTITISFWAKATSGTPKIGIGYTQYFGSGGSPSANVLGNIGITAALTAVWTRYTATASVASTSGKTAGTNGDEFTQIELYQSVPAANSFGMYPASGSLGQQSGTVQLWGLQLEIAAPGQTQPTPLEKPDPQQDLAKCQRFYQVGSIVGGSYALAGNTVYVGGLFPVLMRAAPTVVNTGFSGGNLTGTFTPGSTAASFYISGVTNTAATYIFNNSFSASADL